MAKTLAELVSALQEEIPASGGVPSSTQYQRAIVDAVMDFSRRAGTEKITTLNVVAGTASYNLPADFLMLISMTSLYHPSGVLNTPQGLIPLRADFCETFTFRNGQITITPTPTYSLARQMSYKAGWALTGEGEEQSYEDMDEEVASIVLLKAQALAQTKKNNATAGNAYRYTVGGVTVDTTAQADATNKDVSQLESEYEARVDKYVGHAFLFE